MCMYEVGTELSPLSAYPEVVRWNRILKTGQLERSSEYVMEILGTIGRNSAILTEVSRGISSVLPAKF